MNVFLWHVHGSWTTSLVQGAHTYLVPVLPGRGRDGRGRAETWDWPDSVVEISPQEAAAREVDVVVLQRPEELDGLAQGWLGGRRPGHDVAAVYVEHNAPQGRINDLRHPAADRRDLVLVHVTHFNALLWDAGRTPTRVIEHGVIDPGPRYTGELARAAVAINEPARRGRVAGADLLSRFAQRAPLDLFGIGSEEFTAPGVRPVGNLPQDQLHAEMARRRVYLHPMRWTSLGLTLLEAMHLGMPVVALATTEAVEAVPPRAGAISTSAEVLERSLERLIADPDLARASGEKARAAAMARYGLERFLADWDDLLTEVADRRRRA